MQHDSNKVLIVEDDAEIAGLVALHLQDFCGEVRTASDGHEGMRLACGKSWDLIVLDIRLPGPNGLDICRALRKNESYVPILMLTSKSTELDRVLGLEIGADDYLTKPFSIPELLARVKSILRRVDMMKNLPVSASDRITIGAIHLDPAGRSVAVGSRSVSLTAREFDLLLHFARHPGRVFRRSELLDRVWGASHEGFEHTVNSHINRLRAKIERDPTNPASIVTVWGVGYKLDPNGSQGQAS